MGFSDELDVVFMKKRRVSREGVQVFDLNKWKYISIPRTLKVEVSEVRRNQHSRWNRPFLR